MRMSRVFWISLFLTIGLNAQPTFDIHLEPLTIQGLGGLQSYAYAQHNGHWVFIGGRLDGLHRRQPWATFDQAGHNTQIYVVDYHSDSVWTASIQSLPPSLQDQLSSTNTEFHQDGNELIIIGGYGYSQVISDHRTHPYMTIVDLQGLITAVKSNSSLTPFFRQVTDPYFAVTGGYLQKMYDRYYIVGGQKFDGRYNPMGHGTFTQEYTDAVKRFEYSDDGQTITVNKLTSWVDTNLLHRRDFNVMPQVSPSGEQYIIAFAGVFQHNVDLPFLNTVRIDSNGYQEIPVFEQKLQQYHCAHIPLFESSTASMQNLFFGGMSQFYVDNGSLVEDQNVPFVQTISTVTVDGQGALTEWIMPGSMPDYLGGSAELIPSDSLIAYQNGVIDLDANAGDTLFLGHIYGGIKSTAANIFWINNGTQSSATTDLFKVYLIRNAFQSIEEETDLTGFQLKAWSEDSNRIKLRFSIEELDDIELWITDTSGKELLQKTISKNKLNLGANSYSLERNSIDLSSGTVIIGLRSNKRREVVKVLLDQ